MRKLKWGPSAFAVSMIALVVSLGGTGHALTQTRGSAVSAGKVALAGYAPDAGMARLPAWHALHLTNGWHYAAFNSYQAAWYKDSGGVVHLRGSAKGGGIFSPVFRLPSWARPSRTLWLPVYAYQGSSGGLKIQPDGQAFLFDSAFGANVTKYASLDGVTFRVP